MGHPREQFFHSAKLRAQRHVAIDSPMPRLFGARLFKNRYSGHSGKHLCPGAHCGRLPVPAGTDLLLPVAQPVSHAQPPKLALHGLGCCREMTATWLDFPKFAAVAKKPPPTN